MRNMIILGNVLIAITFVCVYNGVPAPNPRLDTPTVRVIYALRLSVCSALMMAILVMRIANTRFVTKAINPVEGNAENLVQVDKNCLQNTLEQLVLHVIAQVALASNLSAESAHVLPLMTSFFVIGRVLFVVGYHRGAKYRALGFTITWSPNCCSLVYSTFCLLWAGPTHALIT